jgi:hypothetical protein
MYAVRVCAHTQRTSAAARESLRRDRPVGLTSPAFRACGSSFLCTLFGCHSSQNRTSVTPTLVPEKLGELIDDVMPVDDNDELPDSSKDADGPPQRRNVMPPNTAEFTAYSWRVEANRSASKAVGSASPSSRAAQAEHTSGKRGGGGGGTTRGGGGGIDRAGVSSRGPISMLNGSEK